jgi:hypothetical protein
MKNYTKNDLEKAFYAAKQGKIEKVPVVIDQYGSVNIEEHFVPNKYPTFEDYFKTLNRYFAKYLPIEGEVKNNDTVIFKDRPYRGHATAQIQPDGRIGCPDYKILPRKREDVQLLGLFLCTNNIQVGDKNVMYLGSDNNYHPHPAPEVTGSDYRRLTEQQKLEGNQIFQVIGLISPDATWVREGDEFGDEGLKLVSYD